MSDSLSLKELRALAATKGYNLSMLNIEVHWEDDKADVLAQADLDRGDDQDFETALFEGKGRTIEAALTKVRSMIEGIKDAE